MIERAENLLEILVVGICLVLSLNRARMTRKKGWLLLGLVYASYLLGDLYWTLYLFFYGKTPAVFYVSELSWCAAYVFLLLLLRHYQTDAERALRSPVLWVIPLFVMAMTAFYMTRGDYLLNITEAVLMCQLMMRSAQGLLALRGTADRRKSLYTMVLIFCLIEYMVWTSSCFWAGDTIRNTYFWFAALLISCHPFFLWAVGKAEEA